MTRAEPGREPQRARRTRAEATTGRPPDETRADSSTAPAGGGGFRRGGAWPAPHPHEPLTRAPPGLPRREPLRTRELRDRRGCLPRTGCSCPCSADTAARTQPGGRGPGRAHGDCRRRRRGPRGGAHGRRRRRPQRRGAAPGRGTCGRRRLLLFRGPPGADRAPPCPRPRPLPPSSGLSAFFPPLFRSSPDIQDGGAGPVT